MKNSTKKNIDEILDLKGHNLPEGTNSLLTLAVAEDIPAITQADVDRLCTDYKNLLEIINRVPEEIQNDEIYDRFTALVAQVQVAKDKREETRKKLKEPYNKAATAIEHAFKLIKDNEDLQKNMEAAFVALKQKMSIYDTKKYEAEEASRHIEQERIASATAKDGIKMDSIEVAPIKMGSQKSEYGGTSIREIVTDWEVINESLLPRIVMSIDPKKVDQIIASGAKEIPGIKISKKVKTSVRRS